MTDPLTIAATAIGTAVVTQAASYAGTRLLAARKAAREDADRAATVELAAEDARERLASEALAAKVSRTTELEAGNDKLRHELIELIKAQADDRDARVKAALDEGEEKCEQRLDEAEEHCAAAIRDVEQRAIAAAAQAAEHTEHLITTLVASLTAAGALREGGTGVHEIEETIRVARQRRTTPQSFPAATDAGRRGDPDR